MILCELLCLCPSFDFISLIAWEHPRAFYDYRPTGLVAASNYAANYKNRTEPKKTSSFNIYRLPCVELVN